MVRFENVGLRYGMGPEVLRDVSFSIEPQSFQFLTGPSGAGKTTLLRLILLSLRPTRGLIDLFGHDVAGIGKDKTVVVAISKLIKHARYHKFVRRRVKYKAHDEQNHFRTGDTVEIEETRPLSREKRWRVIRLVERPPEA